MGYWINWHEELLVRFNWSELLWDIKLIKVKICFSDLSHFASLFLTIIATASYWWWKCFRKTYFFAFIFLKLWRNWKWWNDLVKRVWCYFLLFLFQFFCEGNYQSFQAVNSIEKKINFLLLLLFFCLTRVYNRIHRFLIKEGKRWAWNTSTGIRFFLNVGHVNYLLTNIP